MMIELDESDRADLRAQDARARRAGRAVCSECGMVGGHLNGCPEAPETEDDEGETEE